MKRMIIRLSEEELKGIMHKSVKRALNEHFDRDKEIRLAQKELMKMSSPLSSVGMRLEGTRFFSQYKSMHDAIIILNNSLIEYIRRSK